MNALSDKLHDLFDGTSATSSIVDVGISALEQLDCVWRLTVDRAILEKFYENLDVTDILNDVFSVEDIQHLSDQRFSRGEIKDLLDGIVGVNERYRSALDDYRSKHSIDSGVVDNVDGAFNTLLLKTSESDGISASDMLVLLLARRGFLICARELTRKFRFP